MNCSGGWSLVLFYFRCLEKIGVPSCRNSGDVDPIVGDRRKIRRREGSWHPSVGGSNVCVAEILRADS
jgi:hypothetical protein